MTSERLNNNRTEDEKPAWMVERERDLAKKRRIGETVLGLAAAIAIIGGALSHSAKTSEIMTDEERAKNVKKIEAEAVVFHDGVNVRKEPFVDNANPNQLADIDGEGHNVIVDYDGEVYYYNNENDANGDWYGFEAEELSDVLSEKEYISGREDDRLKADKDGTVWLNGNYVSIIEPGEADRMAAEWVD